MKKHNINETLRIFYLDEAVLSLRSMTLDRSKCEVGSGTSRNKRKPEFRGSCDHETTVPVISAVSQVLTPIAVLFGVGARWRKRGDGKFEAPVNFLPQPSHLITRAVLSVETNIFLTWVTNFVQETAFLKKQQKNAAHYG